MEVRSKLVLREFGAERADFATSDETGCVTEIGSTGRQCIALFGFLGRTKFIECGRSAVVGEYVELFGPGEVGEFTFFVLVAFYVL